MAVAYEKDEHLTPGTGLEEDTATELVHTIDISGKYDWKSSYATSFEKAKTEIQAGPEPDVVKEKAVELLKWVEGRMTNSETGAFDGGIRFRVFARPFPGTEGVEYRATKLEVGFKTEKAFGFVDDAQPPKAGVANDYRINFVIEGEGQAERVMNEALSKSSILVQLLTDAQKRRTTEFLNSLGNGNVRDLLTEKPSVFTAQELYDQLLKFVRNLFDASNVLGAPAKTYFYEEVRRGRGEETDLGFNARAKVIGFAVDPLRAEYVTTHETAKGTILGGAAYLLEDYSSIVIEPPDGKDILLSIIEQRLNQFYAGLGTELRRGWEEHERGKAKGTKADVSASNSIDAKLLDIVSFSVKSSPAPSTPAPYRGNSDRAVAGKPRYGIGDFYSLLATDTLSGPVTLSFSYDDGELDGVDESTLRLYTWDNAQKQWAPVAAAIDLAANRVTATVGMGLYTLAPRMPAGALAWQVVGWSTVSGNTTVTLEASGLRMNDGSALAPGTLVHLQLPGIDPATVTFGSADASGLSGHQTAADGTGVIRVTVTVPGAPTTLDIRGFSDIGTAFGEATVVRP